MDCRMCGAAGVSLIFRGAAIQLPEFRPVAAFACAYCAPSKGSDVPNPKPTRLSYTKTVSQVIDIPPASGPSRRRVIFLVPIPCLGLS